MTGKRNEIELANDRAKIAELMHRGTTSPSELMDLINQGRPKNKHISRQTIANDIEWLKQQYRESAMYDFNEAWHQTLAQYNDLLKVAWAEFYALKDWKLTVTKEGHDEDAEDIEQFNEIMGEDKTPTADSVLSEARTMKSIIKKEKIVSPPVAYLQLIERIIEKIAKMKAVDGTSKIALTDTKGRDLPSATEDILAALNRMGDVPEEHDFIDIKPEQLTEGEDVSTTEK
jgi:hypothetical protein